MGFLVYVRQRYFQQKYIYFHRYWFQNPLYSDLFLLKHPARKVRFFARGDDECFKSRQDIK